MFQINATWRDEQCTKEYTCVAKPGCWPEVTSKNGSCPGMRLCDAGTCVCPNGYMEHPDDEDCRIGERKN